MGENKKLIAGTWSYLSWTDYNKDLPYVEGPLPEFMMFVDDEEFYSEPAVRVFGTNVNRIEMFKKVLAWYWPKTKERVLELLNNLESYHEKSLTIQWDDDFMKRLKKNHIWLVANDPEKGCEELPKGTITFRKKPADLEKLGIKKIRLEIEEGFDSGPAFDGKIFAISDGTTEIYWDWDDHWYCGGWELKTLPKP